MSLEPAELSQAVVFLPHGARKRLGEYWQDKPCLLVFLRHLACPSCAEQTRQVLELLPSFKRAGVGIVLVATSTAARIPAFAVRAHLDNTGIEVVTDPTLEAHRSAGLARSRWKTYGPAAVVGSIQLYTKTGFIQRDPDDGDLLQQGGVVLVDRSGRILFHHVNQNAAEVAGLGEVCSLV